MRPVKNKMRYSFITRNIINNFKSSGKLCLCKSSFNYCFIKVRQNLTDRYCSLSRIQYLMFTKKTEFSFYRSVKNITFKFKVHYLFIFVKAVRSFFNNFINKVTRRVAGKGFFSKNNLYVFCLLACNYNRGTVLYNSSFFCCNLFKSIAQELCMFKFNSCNTAELWS